MMTYEYESKCRAEEWNCTYVILHKSIHKIFNVTFSYTTSTTRLNCCFPRSFEELSILFTFIKIGIWFGVPFTIETWSIDIMPVRFINTRIKGSTIGNACTTCLRDFRTILRICYVIAGVGSLYHSQSKLGPLRSYQPGASFEVKSLQKSGSTLPLSEQMVRYVPSIMSTCYRFWNKYPKFKIHHKKLDNFM